jgi:hypothetical protein
MVSDISYQRASDVKRQRKQSEALSSVEYSGYSRLPPRKMSNWDRLKSAGHRLNQMGANLEANQDLIFGSGASPPNMRQTRMPRQSKRRRPRRIGYSGYNGDIASLI